MAKSTGLAVFALIIAIGALGLGAYQVFFVSAPTSEKSGITNTWYDFHYASENTNPASTQLPIDQLLINFTVNSGESAFFLFSTYATVYAGAPSHLQINFALDGAVLSGPQHPWWVLETFGSRISTPVSFHLALETISPGAHNVSIFIYGNNVNNGIFSSTLLVQTYIS
ncbi:hypothetical protein LCGC14_0543290 [marine sediment metagenome]|uniref:Uncharacterized protein n=1 Tax=marine sediment metagenome TaxID=412755 RepID=A0A0F9V0E8_9ZZZZ|nr:MAG: hypothetical protein Lokiarch_36050 [Candidatus Lokiarchaeum sp. GC14_75]